MSFNEAPKTTECRDNTSTMKDISDLFDDVPHKYSEPKIIDTPQIPSFEMRDDPKKYDGFLFLPSFRESIDNLAEVSPELASDLLWAIIVYGTQDKEIATNPVVKASMASIKKSIKAGKKKRKAIPE